MPPSAPPTPLPSDTVTFLFTDIEGSTERWEHHPEAMSAALTRHDALMRGAIEAHGGESSNRLDLRWVRRSGYLRPGVAAFNVAWHVGDRPAGDIRVNVERGDWPDGVPAALELVYRYRSGGGDWRDVRERVLLDWRPCRYGGARPFMRCPGCRRAVLVLYGGALFRCRRCAGVTYSSTRENALDRTDAKIRGLRRRMGDPDPWRGPVDGWHPRMKPSGMHWSTWWRLRAEWEALIDQWHGLFFADVERLSRFIERIGTRR